MHGPDDQANPVAVPPPERQRPSPTVKDRQAFFRILGCSLLSLAFVFLLDATIFRSNLYTPYLEPRSSTGSYERTLQVEQRRLLLSGTRHVLVFGDSRMAEGFWPRRAQYAAGAGWEFSSVAIARWMSVKATGSGFACQAA